MGGRGSSSGGFGGGGGISSADILSTTSFISERGNYQATVDDALSTLKDFGEQYDFVLDDLQMATLSADASSAIAYYDGKNMGWNEKFMDKDALDKAYESSVKSGFHPKLGNKSSVQAVASHEIGHALTAEVGKKIGTHDIDKASRQILKDAKKQTRHKDMYSLASKISGYAKQKPAETVAEAVCDVYCNGKKARKESQAIVNVINGYLKK